MMDHLSLRLLLLLTSPVLSLPSPAAQAGRSADGLHFSEHGLLPISPVKPMGEIRSRSDRRDAFEKKFSLLRTTPLVPPLPTIGNSTLSLKDGPTTYNLTMDWADSCGSTIIPNFMQTNGTVANITMAEAWADVASSSDDVARDILKKELQETIKEFNNFAGELLGDPPMDFIPSVTSSTASGLEVEKRDLSWIRKSLDKLVDVFYQEGNISWILAVLPIYGGLGYSIQRIAVLSADADKPVENLSVIGVGATSILVKAAVGRVWEKTELLQISDRFILRLLGGGLIRDLIRTIRQWVTRDDLALPLNVPNARQARQAMQAWQSGEVGPRPAGAPTGNAGGQSGNADGQIRSADGQPGSADGQPGNADGQPGNADGQPGNAGGQSGNADSPSGSADAPTGFQPSGFLDTFEGGCGI